MRDRLTIDRRKIFARECPTLMSMTKDELRRHYNEIFDRLQEYEVAEEQGQIFAPPCKVGDTVYWVSAWDSYATQKDHKGIVNFITVNGKDIYFSTQYKTLKLSDYRKSWFVDENEQKTVVRIMQKTRKEAEQALRKEEEGK